MRDVEVVGQNSVEVSGLAEVGTFSILANGKAFKILIDGLYSDKPRAIVRELCTNAFDSHVMAGVIDRPFKVHLPSRFDQTFSVRDFGISLTHADVMGLYTTVFSSTKDGDNKNVGKFGLGSKTPFAYTDSFSLGVVLNGEKRSYNAFIDTNGIPKIALFAREETDEEQGVEVSFSVKHTDIQAFQTAFKRVMLGFDVFPQHTLEDFAPEPEVVSQGAGWRILKRDHDLGLNGAFVRQGCVLYPLDQAALNAVRQSIALETLAGEVIVIDMPIGTVEITPSRESISYDTTTATNILNKLDGLLDEVVAKITSQMKAATTRYEATKFRRELLQTISNSRLRDFVGKRLKFRGRHLLDHIHISREMGNSLRRHGVDPRHLILPKNHRRSATPRRELHSAWDLTLQELPTFVYWSGEAPSYLGYRLAAAAADRSISGEIIALPNFTPGSKAEKYLLAALGRPDEPLKFVDLMTFAFEKPDYQRTLASLKVWDHRRDRFDDGTAPGIEQANVFYCHTFRDNPKRGEHEVSNHTVARVWDQLKQHNILPKDAVLVGIPASRKDIAKNVPEAWSDFFSTVADMVLSRFDAVKAAKAQAASDIASTEDASKWIKLFDAIGKGHNGQSAFWQAKTEIGPYLDNGDGQLHLSLKELITTLAPDQEKTLLEGYDPAERIKEFWAILRPVRATYPLLQELVNSVGRYNSLTLTDKAYVALHDYIALADAREGDERAQDTAWA